MAAQLTDTRGEPVAVSVELSGRVGAYIVSLADGSTAGRAEFVDDQAGTEHARVFFHTEVDPRFGGRGLARVLVREALQDSIRTGFRVVPVCPLFSAHLKTHGDEFVSAGGVSRRPTPADIAMISRLVRHRS